jgi:tetratricopeptide (TPR) repeat protein
VRSELDADVGPEMRLLVAQLRLRAENTPVRAITSDEIAVLTAEQRAAVSAAKPVVAVGPTEPPREQHRSRWASILRSVTPRVHPKRFAILCLAIANIVVIALVGRSKLLGPTTAMGEVPPDSPATIAVFAFDGRNTALTGGLARATTELLAASLDGGTGLTAVTVAADAQSPARAGSPDSSIVDASSAARTAERLGARLFVLGRIVEVGGRLRVTATMHDRSRFDQPIGRASADGSATEMFEVVDRVASQLLAGRFPGTRGALARVAATSSASLPAARSYFAAEQHLGSGRFSAAMDALRDAIRKDSGFAIAYYRLSHAAELNGDETESRQAADAAVRASGRLDDHYRRVLAAAAAREQGDIAGAERAYTRLTLDYPNDADALFGLGEALFHLNPLRGRPSTEARDAFLKALDADPRHVEALMHLARIDAMGGDSAGVDRWLGRARERSNDALIAGLALLVRSLSGVDRQRLQRAGTTRGGLGPREILVGTDAEDTERFAGQFLTADVPGDLAAYGHRLAAYATSARGQFRAAINHLDQALESDVDSDVEARSLIVATPGAPFDSATIAQTEMAVERWQPAYLPDPDQSIDALAQTRSYALLRLHRLGLIALRGHDTATASKAAERLVKIAEPDSATTATAAALSLSLRARIAAAAGDSARALRLLEQVQWARIALAAPSEPLDRLLRADLLSATGRNADALRWYATLGHGAPQELPLVGFATLGMAHASERMGDRAGALRYYRSLANLWRDADPPLQAILITASRRIAALDSAPPR